VRLPDHGTTLGIHLSNVVLDCEIERKTFDAGVESVTARRFPATFLACCPMLDAFRFAGA
jgi:hypothetical protein